MNAKQLERASYMAAHAILSTDTSAPYLATPGARRSHTIDAIADAIRKVFELHCSALDESSGWDEMTATDNIETLAKEPMRVSGPASSQKLQLIVQELH